MTIEFFVRAVSMTALKIRRRIDQGSFIMAHEWAKFGNWLFFEKIEPVIDVNQGFHYLRAL